MTTDRHITTFHPTEGNWPEFIHHLERVEMTRHALRHGGPKADCHYIGVIVADRVIGHISVKEQPLVVESSGLTDDHSLPLLDADDEPLTEIFVQTFAVEEAFRRQGHGRILQSAALQLGYEHGCYQMRSWSSADRPANYALKIGMGFAIVPALYPTPGGAPISGAYFVKRITGD